MEIFYLDSHPYVELCDLLKLQGWSESGAAAKVVIAEGLVQVDGQVETRKRCKITAGKAVAFNGECVRVEA
ncbi:ribosome-associated protein YbcJ [Xenorhabdus sp. Vera]|nr:MULTISPECIES: ribosome-associated protein YbcJ [unclassified Xenorhabdus]MBD2810255.1 ribosome-associated protein YbcJ [Xenorhabdus sp. Vera]